MVWKTSFRLKVESKSPVVQPRPRGRFPEGAHGEESSRQLKGLTGKRRRDWWPSRSEPVRMQQGGSKDVRNSPDWVPVLWNQTSSDLPSILHFHFTPKVQPTAWKLLDRQSTFSFSAPSIQKVPRRSGPTRTHSFLSKEQTIFSRAGLIVALKKKPRCPICILFPLVAQLNREPQAKENGCHVLPAKTKRPSFPKPKLILQTGAGQKPTQSTGRAFQETHLITLSLETGAGSLSDLLHRAPFSKRLKKEGAILNLPLDFRNKNQKINMHVALWHSVTFFCVWHFLSRGLVYLWNVMFQVLQSLGFPPPRTRLGLMTISSNPMCKWFFHDDNFGLS